MPFSSKLAFRVWVASEHTINYLRYNLCTFILGDGPHTLLTFNQNFWSPFRENDNSVWGVPRDGSLFGARMFIFIGHRPMMDKIITAAYEPNPSNSSGANHGRTHTYITHTVFIVQAYQNSQYVVPCGGIFLGKWRSSFAGSSDDKMYVQSACALNTRYIHAYTHICTYR
jgi:hypothetical protein